MRILEPNFILARFAANVFTGFPNPNYIYAGNPVRENIISLPPPQERLRQHSGPIRLLIIGGSQGALSFNQMIPQALSLFPKEQCPIIWHQAGKKYLTVAQFAYQNAEIDACVDDFIPDMARAYQWADLVIARAGGHVAVPGPRVLQGGAGEKSGGCGDPPLQVACDGNKSPTCSRPHCKPVRACRSRDA